MCGLGSPCVFGMGLPSRAPTRVPAPQQPATHLNGTSHATTTAMHRRRPLICAARVTERRDAWLMGFHPRCTASRCTANACLHTLMPLLVCVCARRWVEARREARVRVLEARQEGEIWGIARGYLVAVGLIMLAVLLQRAW